MFMLLSMIEKKGGISVCAAFSLLSAQVLSLPLSSIIGAFIVNGIDLSR